MRRGIHQRTAGIEKTAQDFRPGIAQPRVAPDVTGNPAAHADGWDQLSAAGKTVAIRSISRRRRLSTIPA